MEKATVTDMRWTDMIRKNRTLFMTDTEDISRLPQRSGKGQAGGVQMSTFGLRLFLAALLFGIYFYGKTQDVSVAGIRMEQVESLVEGQEEQLLELLGNILNRTY